MKNSPFIIAVLLLIGGAIEVFNKSVAGRIHILFL